MWKKTITKNSFKVFVYCLYVKLFLFIKSVISLFFEKKKGKTTALEQNNNKNNININNFIINITNKNNININNNEFSNTNNNKDVNLNGSVENNLNNNSNNASFNSLDGFNSYYSAFTFSNTNFNINNNKSGNQNNNNQQQQLNNNSTATAETKTTSALNYKKKQHTLLVKHFIDDYLNKNTINKDKANNLLNMKPATLASSLQQKFYRQQSYQNESFLSNKEVIFNLNDFQPLNSRDSNSNENEAVRTINTLHNNVNRKQG